MHHLYYNFDLVYSFWDKMIFQNKNYVFLLPPLKRKFSHGFETQNVLILLNMFRHYL